MMEVQSLQEYFLLQKEEIRRFNSLSLSFFRQLERLPFFALRVLKT
jgi:hypothetical protein